MREFICGTDEQFDALDRELSSGRKLKFPNRLLPPSCSPATASLWFAKTDGVYFLYVDRGIVTNAENQDFRLFLERGVCQFICMDDMAAFFRSLGPLFQPPANSGRRTDPPPEQDAELTAPRAPEEPVVDKLKLRAIRSAEHTSRLVWPEELAAPLKQKVFGQDEAIDALADLVAIHQMRKKRSLLTIALMGPTATGKSETAKSLAEVMSEAYKTQYGFIELAGSEFIGEHTVHRFFGAPPGYVGHGQDTVLEPVRKNPHHIIVINEIEKANDKLLVGLMEAIDTGKLGMADNSKPIELEHCILLLTSNIPIEMESYQACSPFERAELCRDAFTRHCGRPEISGKIGNFLVFQPLDDMATADIIIKFVREELDSFDLGLAHIDANLMADFLKHQTKYGARGIRSLVSNSVGSHLLRNRGMAKLRGKAVALSGTIDKINFEVA